MSVRFMLNETSYFGKGAREELPREIKERGFKKVLVVTDKALFEVGVTARVTEVLDKAGIKYTVINAEKEVELTVKYGVKKAPTLLVPDGAGYKAYDNASEIRKYIESKD